MKAFLAGKRGICPDCDIKFIVPKLSGGLAVSVNSAVEMPSSDESVSASAPQVPTPPEVSTSIEPPPVGPSDALPTTIDQSLPDTWYVKPVSGEQYGPANTDLIQSWVAEGRVAEDSWVWRTGWDNWKIAHEVFELLKPTSPAAPKVQIEQSRSEESLAPKLRKSKPNSRKERARRVSLALGTLVFVLTVVLVLVLWYQS